MVYFDEYFDYEGNANPNNEQTLSHIQVSCNLVPELSDREKASHLGRLCDQFEVGIIGNLEYEMYDIVIMLTSVPDKVIVD